MKMKQLSRKLVANTGAGAKSAYATVINHPKSTTAVLLGTGVAAALWWVMRDPERVAALKQKIAQRADAWRKAREQRAA
jgi:hypothetical protein